MKKDAATKQYLDSYSKKILHDLRILLWVVNVGGLLLAAYCVHEGNVSAFPWITAMIGPSWVASGTVLSFYLNMSKSDHKVGGITYDSAKANGFQKPTVNEQPI